MNSDLLYVIVSFFNPIQYKSRIRLQQIFEKNIQTNPNIKLVTVECAYNDRNFDLPDNDNIIRIQVRARTLVWNKENLINIGIKHLPNDWKFMCWADGDILFEDKEWAKKSTEELEKYHVIQPWFEVKDLGPNGEPLNIFNSFCYQYFNSQPCVPDNSGKFWKANGGPYTYPHPGFAWCATREIIEGVGGLFEIGALGAGDHHMALALIGEAKKSVPRGMSSSYLNHLLEWERLALKFVNEKLGVVQGTISHSFHGFKKDRKYWERWRILIDNKFDPDVDLTKNEYGVMELTDHNPKLKKDIENYFQGRNEDA